MKIPLFLVAVLGAAAAAVAPAATPHIDLGIEAEKFEFTGDWGVGDPPQASGGQALVSGTKVDLPAATAVGIPRPGRYFLWVRAMDFPQDRPGIRRFTVSVGGQKSPRVFGTSGQPGFSWEAGGSFELVAGPVLISLQALTAFARADAVLLTTDPAFRPAQPLGATGRHRRVAPERIAVVQLNDPLGTLPAEEFGTSPQAELANDFVRLRFVPAKRGGQATVCPQVAWRTATGWADVACDPGAEIYAVIDAGSEARMTHAGFYPQWQSGHPGAGGEAIKVSVGGVAVTTARAGHGAIWQAGKVVRCLPQSARREGDVVRLDFAPTAVGTLAAEWELRPHERAARVRLRFKPNAAGQYALGYHLFFRRPLAAVKEILLPMMWHRHRLPQQPRTLLDPFTPTPVALAEVAASGGSQVWAVAGEPAEIPWAWPQPSQPHFGLAIRDHAGAVQPAIYGPVPGTAAARRLAGETVSFSFRVLVQAGDWYAGFRTAADEINGLCDYRRNVGTSLTDAALNMIDLLKDDDSGGWWQRGKGFYQIETKNGVTQASPLILLSLYRLTGDDDLYRRRVLPTMEYVLSRRSPHFSPLPHDTGRYDAGGMDGPIKLFGTTTFAGLWEMSRRRSAAFGEIALPLDGVRPTAGYSHGQPYDDWLTRFEATGDRAALAKACELADAYIAKTITRPPADELGAQPFFFLTFVPGWEGLLRLYEATGEKRYLDAAAFGARQLMTGLWTQPLIPASDITIHPGGQFKGDSLPSWRGAEHYRLGTPRRRGDTPERTVPAWVVSNVGLGFEQPSTYKGSGPGRLIFQMGWAADFLRLARHTGDPAFETCARNAVVGRWANYPGYYATGFTDLPLNPRYPYEGPDVTDFYYHHIAPHLAWTIDFLVAEAELRSGGRISFPSQRQNGYAYFDSRVYGHAPGRIFGASGVSLWLRRGLVAIDNPQLNFLTAHRGGDFYVVLMNEAADEQRATVGFPGDALGFGAAGPTEAEQVLPAGTGERRVLAGGRLAVVVPPRGLQVWRLQGAKIAEAAHWELAPPAPGAHPGYVVVPTNRPGVEARAACLQVASGPWDAFLWCTATPGQARRVTLHYTFGGEWRTLEDNEYPYEFSVPVPEARTPCRFYLTGQDAAGGEFRSAEATLGAQADATGKN